MEESIGHQFGNFHSYYRFHPVTERTQYFTTGMFSTIWEADGKPPCFTMLDVGCNEGDLTIEMALLATKDLPKHVSVKVLGLDLDSELISRASIKLDAMRHSSSLPSNCTIEFNTCNLTLPASYSEDGVVQTFLQSCGDTSSCIQSNTFSFITLFSVTMWVHLQVGDDQFKSFLHNICNLTSSSILIEPQPWKCYRAAARRCRKQSLPSFPYPPDTLKLTDIDDVVRSIVIEECHFSSRCSWSLGTESWGRTLVVYHRETKPCLMRIMSQSSLESLGTCETSLDGKNVTDAVVPSTVTDTAV